MLLLVATALVSLYLGVPFAPSGRRAIEAVITAIPLKPTDTAYELGSGDGRLAFALSKAYGCSVVGFELAPLIFLWAQLMRLLKQNANVTFLMKDFLSADLKKANALYVYLTPNMLEKLAQKIETDKLHTTVISHSFAIHRWTPVQTIPKDLEKKTPVVYIYKT